MVIHTYRGLFGDGQMEWWERMPKRTNTKGRKCGGVHRKCDLIYNWKMMLVLWVTEVREQKKAPIYVLVQAWAHVHHGVSWSRCSTSSASPTTPHLWRNDRSASLFVSLPHIDTNIPQQSPNVFLSALEQPVKQATGKITLFSLLGKNFEICYIINIWLEDATLSCFLLYLCVMWYF